MIGLRPFDVQLLGGIWTGVLLGPITLLVIRRTLSEGQVVGLASGLGVATARHDAPRWVRAVAWFVYEYLVSYPVYRWSRHRLRSRGPHAQAREERRRTAGGSERENHVSVHDRMRRPDRPRGVAAECRSDTAARGLYCAAKWF